MQDQGQPQNELPNQGMKYKKIENYIFSYSWKLGSGSFGQVYRGVDTKTNMTVAIKIIKKSQMNTRLASSLLSQQISILKQINSEYLIRCLDVINSNNNVYIVTEFCKFGDLSGLLAIRRAFEENQISMIVLSLFQGLKYLSVNNIIHRDLKTANIFVAEGGRAKIADFGFAIKATGIISDICLGSPLYMAPQAIYFNKYGHKTDIWAFGVILYELVTGKPPLINARTKQQLRDQILLPPPTITTKISPSLQNFITRCLTINLQQRISIQQMQNHEYIRYLILQNQQKYPSSSTSMLDSSKADSRKSSKSSNIIYQADRKELMYEEAVGLLQYCRLVAKLCERVRSVILEQWLLRVIYDLHRTKLKEKQPIDYGKYHEVVANYYNRYSKQFRFNGETVTILDALNECEQLLKRQPKFKQQITAIGTETNLLQEALTHPLKLLYFAKSSQASTYMS